MKKLLSAIFAILATASLAWGIQITTVTGPQDPSQFNATINSKIVEINRAIGVYAKDPGSSTYYPWYSMAHGTRLLVFTPTATASYAYVVLDANASDQEEQCVFSSGAITFLYLYAAPAADTVTGAATTLAANGKTCMLYSTANATWNRSQ